MNKITKLQNIDINEQEIINLTKLGQNIQKKSKSISR